MISVSNWRKFSSLSHCDERQVELKTKLRTALQAENEEDCWAFIEWYTPPNNTLPRIMKLLAVNGYYYSSMSLDRHYSSRKAWNCLVHEDEFYVHWVGSGPNAVGGIIMTGEECESSFFMYRPSVSDEDNSDEDNSDESMNDIED